MNDNTKKDLRSHYQQERKKIPPTLQRQWSETICDSIIKLDFYKNHQHIALFYAFDGEVCLNTLWHHAETQKKTCYFPVMCPHKQLLFLPASPSTLFIKNNHGLLEPQVALTKAIPMDELDLLIMPLVAFDKYGTRLGMGGGYYDKSLAGIRNFPRVGVAYACQQAPYLPRDSWDVPLTGIITEKQVLFWPV